MKILLLAPHPFYQERGTPIAVDLLLRTLVRKGHEIDVLTYHEGSDRSFDGTGVVRIHRISPPPGCQNIRPGFSFKKLLADVYMHRAAMRLVRQSNYDVVHAVEESAFMAMNIRRRRGIPYIFDMDSSMPMQMVEKLSILKPLMPVFRRMENSAIRNAMAVTAVCDSLADLARQGGANKISILRDIPLGDTFSDQQSGQGFRSALGISGVTLLYIGNLEAYQGIDLLLNSFARIYNQTDANLVIVGGIPKHVDAYRALAEKLGVNKRTHIIGPRPLSDMNALMREADILVSPRIKGNNTPMKIYSYMAAGKAILATDLFTHTQVLDDATAKLAAPDTASFATAMLDLIQSPEMRDKTGRESKHVVETRFSLKVFEETVDELYQWIGEQTANAMGHQT
ncbi:MAG TPA: glycosyltransferase family 4 protein [Kiritimatiellia bacterium]|nr:glycosyltransferase family 4 protein [Kiritimatiellia bacterium]